MSKFPDLTKVKLTFYPMAGSVDQQFQNLLNTLLWVNENKATPKQVYEQLRDKYQLSHYFARDIYTVLFVSSGLVATRNEKCHLTTAGKVVLETSSPFVLLEIFEKSFAGVAGFLEVLRAKSKINSGELVSAWYELVKDRFPKMQDWSRKTLSNQSRHRIDWLRTMKFIEVKNGLFSLTESGWQFVLQNPPELIAVQTHEIKEQEKQLRKFALHDFKPFDTANKIYSLRQTFARDRAFRAIVTTQYEYYCAVCGIKLPTPRGVYLAEAAHIIPKHSEGSDDPRNGLCLCRNCHWAFDEGVIAIDSNKLTVMIASYLQKTNSDQKITKYNGKEIRSVKDINYSPSKVALEWHREQIFLG
ncbi:MAG: HNH endonuclease [Anaerolineales bacterium]|nr:HNH endonuclease [Anaerolineales bacterium]